jgi:DNA-binding NtrC family response regulator
MAKHILYVDDNEVMLNLVKLLLEQKGYTVMIAKNVDDALRVAGKTKFSMMVIDVNIAGDSGVMLMNFMRHNHDGIPVILYSGGERDETTVDKLIALGAAKYVQKRDGSELVTAVSQACPLS